MKIYSPKDYLLLIPAILIAITVHEFTKAAVSTALGDVLPKKDKKLTLNPFKHFEPIGFILFLVFGYGWGAPVKTAPVYYKTRKKGITATFVSPIVANLIFALLLSISYRLLVYCFPVIILNYYVVNIIAFTIRFNIALAVFNLIPVYPLCGDKLLRTYCSPKTLMAITQYEKFFQIVLLISMMFGFLPMFLNIFVNVIFKLFTV